MYAVERPSERSERSPKRQNGDTVIRDRLLVRHQLQHIAHGSSKARRYRFAQVDQRNHVERGFIRASEGPEITDDMFVVDDGKVRLRQAFERMIALIGGEERNPDLRDVTVIRGQI